MPTYDYECDEGHHFEMFQSMKDDPIKECLECGAPVRRLIGPGAGFLFKGDGFYITDYRSKEYKDKAKSDHKASDTKASDSSTKATDGGKKSSTDSKSKPAKKSDPSSGGSGKN